MFNAKWILRLVSGSIVFLWNHAAWANDSGKKTPDLGGHARSFIKTLSDAVNGGEAAAVARKDLIETAGNATLAIALLFMCYIVASWVGRSVGGMVTSKVDVTLGKFLNKAVRNLIMLVVGMVAIQVIFEVEVAGLAAILAATGFAIGLALQGTLANFAAGVMLLVFRPFKVEDYIAVAGTEGTVEEIDLFTTRLNSPDNRHLIVPNGEIFGAKLENYSRNALRRVDVNVGAAYSADLEQTRKALQSAVDKVSLVSRPADTKLDVPDSQVYLMELGPSSVDWQIRVWCHPSKFWGVRESLTAEAKIALDDAGISIPYPQMDVHVVGKLLAKAA